MNDAESKSSSPSINKKIDNNSSKRCCCCSCKNFFIILLTTILLLFAVIFVIIPLIFSISTDFQRSIFFGNNFFRTIKSPEKYGLNCTVSLFINSTGKIQLGTWHTYPSAECDKSRSDGVSFNNAELVVIYCHGIVGTRATFVRKDIHRSLHASKLQAHVVAFDYRGYADSTHVDPTADGMAWDTIAVYQWVLDQGVPRERILMFGHSMGTAVLIRALSMIPPNEYPIGAVLVGAFARISEEIVEFPLSKLYSWLPYFNMTFADPIINNPEFNFDSISLLPMVQCPLLILHSLDDPIVPYSQGKKLYETARVIQPMEVSTKTKFIAFPAGKGYGHNRIINATELPEILANFIESIKSK